MNEKILQFGEGNFLRAFFDCFVQDMVDGRHFDGSVVVVQPIEQGRADEINAAGGRYGVLLRGLADGKPVQQRKYISCISRAINPYTHFYDYLRLSRLPHLRFVVSNTTEAGIVYNAADDIHDTPAAGFPAKVTQLLYQRFIAFGDDADRGLVFLPCELIENGGDALRDAVLRHAHDWKLGDAFAQWVQHANHFTNTLVDRIVTGHDAALAGGDPLFVTGEIFHFFAIEATAAAARIIENELPLASAGLNVIVTDDISAYKLRKVRILNGAHTAMTFPALLCGIQTVGECVSGPALRDFVRRAIFDEILPQVRDRCPQDAGLAAFAHDVLDRFANPHIVHNLRSIALNSIAKFAARVLPSIVDFHAQHAQLPPVLMFSFAALTEFYSRRDFTDTADVQAFFARDFASGDDLVRSLCANTTLWGADLLQIPGFCDTACHMLREIRERSPAAAMQKLLNGGAA